MLLDILTKINFLEKYRNLTNSSECKESIVDPDLERMTNLLKKINTEAKFFKKEKFFRLVVKEGSKIFWIHIEIYPSINFLFYEMNEMGKYVAGSPMTALYRKLNNGDVSSLGNLYYCSYDEFEKIVSKGYDLCMEIIHAYDS